MMPCDDRYIWHETIQTQHTRRSFLSEVAPYVLARMREWASRGTGFACPAATNA
jgi:hypothetical protein